MTTAEVELSCLHSRELGIGHLLIIIQLSTEGNVPRSVTAVHHRAAVVTLKEGHAYARNITRCRLREFIHTPSSKPIGHNLARHSLVRLNCIRTGYGRFKSNMNQMGISPSASCECGAANQTTQHVCRIQLLNHTQEGETIQGEQLNSFHDLEILATKQD